jgi:hypothetical protein
MADSSQQSYGDRARHRLPRARPPASAAAGLPAVLATLGIAVGAALLGVAGGFAWAAAAPEALFRVSSPGVAYVVNPETTAFIAGDGWFSLVAVAGGILIGVAGYLLGVRRYGPLPVAGLLVGATVAGFLASLTGRNVGLAAFRRDLATGRAGDLLHQPVVLGAQGALAFWPLAAGATVGAIELVAALRDRRHRLAPDPAAAARPPLAMGPFGVGGRGAANGGTGGGGTGGGGPERDLSGDRGAERDPG